MKKAKMIKAGLIAAVLLASISTVALGDLNLWQLNEGKRFTNGQWIYDRGHWHPYTTGLGYFFGCTIGGECSGSHWRD